VSEDGDRVSLVWDDGPEGWPPAALSLLMGAMSAGEKVVTHYVTPGLATAAPGVPLSVPQDVPGGEVLVRSDDPVSVFLWLARRGFSFEGDIPTVVV
jgi:hypothetical protein